MIFFPDRRKVQEMKNNILFKKNNNSFWFATSFNLFNEDFYERKCLHLLLLNAFFALHLVCPAGGTKTDLSFFF